MFRRPSESERGGEAVGEWEVRPGGMLVQKRNQESDQDPLPTPTIRIKGKQGSLQHEIRISPQASFGELKKILAEKTGMHPDDQRILFKRRERKSKSFLDVERVRDGSKLVVVEDSGSRERRCLEMLKDANLQRCKSSLALISSQVDKFAQQVAEMEGMPSITGEIGENLTANLMWELVRLDELVVEGDLKLQKRLQEKRIQKCVETLDKLRSEEKGRKQEEKGQKKQNTLNQSQSFLVSTNWETFD